MYRTTPKVAVGLDAVRPAWCPGVSLKEGVRDPCEIKYSFDLPLVGQTTFGLPIPQMTNDALTAVQKQLPGILDQSLPVIYQKAQPYIEDITDYVIPNAVNKILTKQVAPMVDNQKEEVIAHANLLVQKVLLGVGVITAAGLGAYWYIQKRAR